MLRVIYSYSTWNFVMIPLEQMYFFAAR